MSEAAKGSYARLFFRRAALLCSALATVAFPLGAHAQVSTFAQNLSLPRASQKAVTTQQVGLSQITVTYHRPGVKGRVIWGGLEKLNGGKPFPWRAGANENTTIAFSHNAEIEGNTLPAGTYGLHIALGEQDWAIIFSANSTSWGSYFYKSEEDALRITIAPQDTFHQEWLTYAFEDLTDDSALVTMHWEKKKIAFRVKFDVHTIALENIRRELRSVASFSWQGWYQGAEYCLQNEINYEEALGWAEESVKRHENFHNLRLKGEIFARMGETEEAKTFLRKALGIAPENRKESIEKILVGLD